MNCYVVPTLDCFTARGRWIARFLRSEAANTIREEPYEDRIQADRRSLLTAGDGAPGRTRRGGALRLRRRGRRAAQRARRRPRLAGSEGSPRDAARVAGDHQAAMVGGLPLLRGKAPDARGRAGFRSAGDTAPDRSGERRAGFGPTRPPNRG